MATFTQPKDPGDLLLVEVCAGWTKDKVTLLGGPNYLFGQVLAKVSGKYQVLDLAGTGAAKKSAAILLEAVDATAGDQPGLVISRGATVDLAELAWPAGITEPQKATALDELNALGIVARTAL
ncbi:head decoration protein [Pseudomonas chlororaphis]|uniref:Head decoration protein n=1 Tax=Pseudomonas chlororaphis TaxID=587753 RepID=A0A1Q8EPV1_9PSED|nr:head decoration protein [Pseudomonas chlororaphis]OLF53796.1 head decoration protein [Pseudomonas chlororaphis]